MKRSEMEIGSTFLLDCRKCGGKARFYQHHDYELHAECTVCGTCDEHDWIDKIAAARSWNRMQSNATLQGSPEAQRKEIP